VGQPPLRTLLRITLLGLLIAGFGCELASAEDRSSLDGTLKIPEAAQSSSHFNADSATDAYMAMLPASAKARSDAYFEGGYWLILWNFVCTAAISLLLLETRWSARMRDLAVRLTRFRWLQTLIYWVQFLLVTTLLGFPLEFYEDYIREHQYGLATQTFGPWMGDRLTTLLVELILGGAAIGILFAIVRRLRRSWWAWGSLALIVLLVVQVAIAPILIQPLFNTIKPLHDAKITGPILSMARANGIPATDVYEIDASRQSTRISANVSGFGNTTRITLNDNLLRRGSPEEIQAVMGHEMGHYVMHHIPLQVLEYSLVIVFSFGVLYWSLNWLLARYGHRWQISDTGDPAVLPLVVLVGSFLVLLLTPVSNTIVRTQEIEADTFGLNAARQPDGFAQAALQLSEYRKMHPGKLEEFLFFDHPSGYHRIHAAMIWKSQNLNR